MNMHEAEMAMAGVGTLRRGVVWGGCFGKLPSRAWVNSIRDAVYRAPSTDDIEAPMMTQLNIVAMTGRLRLLRASTNGLELVLALAHGEIASRMKMPTTNSTTTISTVQPSARGTSRTGFPVSRAVRPTSSRPA